MDKEGALKIAKVIVYILEGVDYASLNEIRAKLREDPFFKGVKLEPPLVKKIIAALPDIINASTVAKESTNRKKTADLSVRYNSGKVNLYYLKLTSV